METVRLSATDAQVRIFSLAYIKGDVWTGCSDGSLRVFGGEPPCKEKRRWNAHEGRVYCIIVCRKSVWSLGENNMVRVWNKSVRLCGSSPSEKS